MKITEFQEKIKRPVRILQFGEGNFLRAFIEDFVENANREGSYNGGICIVKPRPGGDITPFLEQNCLYTLIVRGIKNGEPLYEQRIITAIDSIITCDSHYNQFLELAASPDLQVVISNTTEAGICVNPEDKIDTCPQTYPGKLTRFLYERFVYFRGNSESGLVLLPLELNENNGELLKYAIFKYSNLWGLGNEFEEWIEKSNVFCNTLVDRIVSGYMEEELQYQDKLTDVCEPYCFFAIETKQEEIVKEKFPIVKGNPNILLTKDLTIYRERKVKVLNGIHTAVSLAAFTAGYQYVRDFVKDETFLKWIDVMLEEEIFPTINIKEEELICYGEQIIQRFQNPFLNHSLLDISMNSVAKWQIRILPTIKEYKKRKNELPKGLVFSLAALIFFYKEGVLGKHPIRDTKEILECFSKANSTEEILCSSELWGNNTDFIKTLAADVEIYLDLIKKKGMKGAIRSLCRR